jgi:hypothetical protein
LIFKLSVCCLYASQIYYHPASPQNKYGTPRIKFFDNETIKELTRTDRRCPANLENHLVMQRLAIYICFDVDIDVLVQIHANINHEDLNRLVAEQRLVMLLLQNVRFLRYSINMSHASNIWLETSLIVCPPSIVQCSNHCLMRMTRMLTNTALLLNKAVGYLSSNAIDQE